MNRRSIPQSGLLADFKQFLLRGNVVDLAVAVVIGAAFTGVVTAVVNDIVSPIIGAFGGSPDFSSVHFTINKSEFKIGDLINTIINFVIVAAVVFFVVVKPVNYLIQRSRNEPPVDPTTKACPFCLNEVPLAASRCGFCTSDLEAQAA